jgi:hypothetical protein
MAGNWLRRRVALRQRRTLTQRCAFGTLKQAGSASPVSWIRPPDGWASARTQSAFGLLLAWRQDPPIGRGHGADLAPLEDVSMLTNPLVPAFNRTGTRIVAGPIWDSVTGKRVLQLRETAVEKPAYSFTPDGARVIPSSS